MKIILFLRLTNFKLLRQTEGKSVNNCDFFKLAISVRGGAKKKTGLRRCMQPRTSNSRSQHLIGQRKRNSAATAIRVKKVQNPRVSVPYLINCTRFSIQLSLFNSRDLIKNSVSNGILDTKSPQGGRNSIRQSKDTSWFCQKRYWYYIPLGLFLFAN